ncbi:histidine phosphatase family protein [Treponema sp. OMZ 840]|uniref:histidine phosphatase family protein n=1 Tax=Treponema sp. OMZ 840 TaxID=244313 RepID=UPI003D8CA7FE
MKKIILSIVLLIVQLFLQSAAVNAEDSQITEKNKNRNSGEDTMNLILLCHEEICAESEGRLMNSETDDLSPEGIEAAKLAGKNLKENGYSFDMIYTSHLKRAHTVAAYILKEVDKTQIPQHESSVLYTKIDNNTEEKNIFAIPELRPVIEKINFYLKHDILQNIKAGKNILVVTDKNTIRVFLKYLLNMSDEEIMQTYIPADNSFLFIMDKNLNIETAGFPIWPFPPEKIDWF